MDSSKFKLPNDIQLIGICGAAGSGKDTVANMIKSIQNEVSQISFADPLKACAAAAFGIPLNHFYHSEFKEMVNPTWEISPRKILQFLGTEMFRETINKLIPVGSDFWIYRMAKTLKENYNPGGIVVIPDVRFPNEEYFIRVNKGILLKLIRPGADGRVGIIGHASEIYDLDPDYLIINDGSLEQLKNEVDAFWQHFNLERKQANSNN